MTDSHEPGTAGGPAPGGDRAPWVGGTERSADDGATGTESPTAVPDGVDGGPAAPDEVAPGPPDGGAPGGDPLATAVAQRDEYLDSLRRLQAEFENYKKRVTKQQSDQAARAAASLVDKVLPVLDTLDMATEHLGDVDSADGRALVAVAGQLRDVLAKEGLERIDPLGEAFDPTAHDAVGHAPADDDEGSDQAGDTPADTVEPPAGPVVAQVMRAGYRWRGTVVRPAMVTVRG